MNTYSEGICPLCSQVCLRERLHSHIAEEQARMRERTIQVIQGYHAGWSVEDGACVPCWRSFREAGRILSLLKQTKSKGQGHEWQGPDPFGKAALERRILS